MSIFEKSRFEIFNTTQHPYRHSLSEFAFSNSAIPGATNVETALNYILAVLYPNVEPAVATPDDLPTTGNQLTDYRVVLDDGDGFQAAYRWDQREGDANPSWYKVTDMDYSNDSILAQMMDVTQPLFFQKQGHSDIDANGDIRTGLYAGQTIFGGNLANQNLTLNANSGDGTGAHTGFIQFESNLRPVADDLYNLSTLTERWRNIFLSSSAFIDTMTISSGLIADTNGAISFANNNLTTNGNINGNVITGTQLIANDLTNTMILAPGSISDSTGQITMGVANLLTEGTLGAGVATFTDNLQTIILSPDATGKGEITSSTGIISFDDENLETTGSLTVGNLVADMLNTDNVKIDGNSITTTDVNGDLIIEANGTSNFTVNRDLQGQNALFTGNMQSNGTIIGGNLQIGSNLLTATNTNGDITIDPAGNGVVAIGSVLRPTSGGPFDLGTSGRRWQDIYLSGGLTDGTDSISISSLLFLRSNMYRDLAQTQPAQTGDSLFYDAINNVWLASAPDSEVSHATIAGLFVNPFDDVGHTQFALLAGRAGGQTLTGGTGSSDNLLLSSTDSGTRGSIVFRDNLLPETTATFAGTWSGTDIGSSLFKYNDIYSCGEHKGLRLENIMSTSLPTFSGQTPGRMYYAVDTRKIYVDTGASLIGTMLAKIMVDTIWDGVISTLDVDISSVISNSQNAVFQLLNNADNFKNMNVAISRPSTSVVRIETNTPLPMGTYRLIGIE